ncbi:MAG: Interferon-induced transmembrane protein [bacterium ADurb.Bin363]|nr:MAG: Interferon-induced transmembrane protein [bacterium ADurb.Bin363]
MQSVPSHLVEAILSTLFCCMPLGIVAIVFAAQVNSKLQMGDYNGALSASKNAGLFSWLSIGLGAGVSILYILFYVIMGLAGAGNY